MEIIVNQKAVTFPDETSVSQLVASLLGKDQQGIAVAVGETIISKKDWDNRILTDNEKVTIITATQGG